MASLVSDLKLSSNREEEEELLTFEDEALKIGEKRLENCLVAKVFSQKAINCDTFVQ